LRGEGERNLRGRRCRRIRRCVEERSARGEGMERGKCEWSV